MPDTLTSHVRPLNDQQALFVRHYTACLDPVQAALRAGYSQGTANRASVQLLRNPSIYQALQQRAKRRAKKLDLSEAEAHQRWVWLARFDPGALVDPVTGLGKRVSELPEHVRYCLEAWELDGEGRIEKFKAFDRKVALDRVTKLHELARDPLVGSALPAGGVTVNHTEIFLQGMTTEELKVMEKVLARTEAARAQAERTRRAVAALPPSEEAPVG